MKQGPFVLVICDGLGYTEKTAGNAATPTNMPFLHSTMREYPSHYLAASGRFVGLLEGFIGNSEVGHLTLGAGRIVQGSIARFHELIQTKKLSSHPVKEQLLEFARRGTRLHIIGLLSDGGVHSHELHLHSILELAVACGITKISVHPILDGRDVSSQSAPTYLKKLEQKIGILRYGSIASLQGRFYAMDRDKNWGRTAASYSMLCGSTERSNLTWEEIISKNYSQGVSDEFIKPVLLQPDEALQNGDALIFVNVRPDRAIQLAQLFTETAPADLQAKISLKKLSLVVTGYRYTADMNNPVILEPEPVYDTLLDVVEKTQPWREVFLLAETEKYAHVTYFFKGMRDEQVPQEHRLLIPSLKLKNYGKNPAMSAKSITTQVQKILTQTKNPLCIINYANADMVGHGGNFTATQEACRILDQELMRLYKIIVEKYEGTLAITADHGKAEEMFDAYGTSKTAHTKNPVPFVVIQKALRQIQPSEPLNISENYGIAHVAPTLLKLMAINQPDLMVDPLF